MSAEWITPERVAGILSAPHSGVIGPMDTGSDGARLAKWAMLSELGIDGTPCCDRDWPHYHCGRCDAITGMLGHYANGEFRCPSPRDADR